MGSKARIAKNIIPIMTEIEGERLRGRWFVDLFAGGMNLIDKVDGPRIANDKHEYLIEMFMAIQAGWEHPDYISEQEYKDIKTNPQNYAKALVGFVGFGCSFAGKWWGGYARGKNDKREDRNYCLESKRNILKQRDKLKGVRFYNLDYQDVPLPDSAVIYCDIPYSNTTKYSEKFDYDRFWDWCRVVGKNYPLYVSEYTAPKYFECVWSKEIVSSLTQDTGSKTGVERLFRYIG